MMHYFFSENGDYLGGFDELALSEVPAGAIEVDAPPPHGLDRLIDGVIVPYSPTPSPLELLVAAVKALPVAKRVNPIWGGFIAQGLMAIQYEDVEALTELLLTFETDDPDYLAIIDQAKALYGI